jgi:hypothetical protein
MDQDDSIIELMVVHSLDLLVTHFGQDLLTSQHWDHNIVTWLLLMNLCTWLIGCVQTFHSLSISWLGIVTILQGDTKLELSRFFYIYEAL